MKKKFWALKVTKKFNICIKTFVNSTPKTFVSAARIYTEKKLLPELIDFLRPTIILCSMSRGPEFDSHHCILDVCHDFAPIMIKLSLNRLQKNDGRT